MPEAVVLSAVRTPVGRHGGALAGERPDDLAAVVIREAVDRAGVAPGEIEDVYFGAANQAGEDNRNVARMAVLLAGLPQEVAGVTLNRLCASGLSAVVSACHAVKAGDGELFVAGGVESMTRAPFVTGKPEHAFPRGNQTAWDTTLGWRFPNPRLEAMFPLESMGETGENVAERFDVTREDQDAFALESQRRHAAAIEGRTLRGRDRAGRREARRADEHPRPETTAGEVGLAASLRSGRAAPSRRQLERHHRRRRRAGDRQRRQGAELGAELLGRLVDAPWPAWTRRSWASARCPPSASCSRGPARGGRHRPRRAERGLRRAEPRVRSASSGSTRSSVNVNGGAIALGHPIGMSGARIVVTLLHEMRRRGGRYGLATLCVGGGMGMAALFER